MAASTPPTDENACLAFALACMGICNSIDETDMRILLQIALGKEVAAIGKEDAGCAMVSRPRLQQELVALRALRLGGRAVFGALDVHAVTIEYVNEIIRKEERPHLPPILSERYTDYTCMNKIADTSRDTYTTNWLYAHVKNLLDHSHHAKGSSVVAVFVVRRDEGKKRVRLDGFAIFYIRRVVVELDLICAIRTNGFRVGAVLDYVGTNIAYSVIAPRLGRSDVTFELRATGPPSAITYALRGWRFVRCLFLPATINDAPPSDTATAKKRRLLEIFEKASQSGMTPPGFWIRNHLPMVRIIDRAALDRLLWELGEHAAGLCD